MSRRYAISAVTVFMLVVLRLNIGWHFFSEGVAHYNDPSWTSEPVLRNATGPLAPLYRSYLPDAHRLDAWLHSARAEEHAERVEEWIKQVQEAGNTYRQRFVQHYGLNEQQQKLAGQVLKDFQVRVRSWAGAGREDLLAHVHEWERMEAAREGPGSADVPFLRQRAVQSRASLVAEAGAWRGELEAMERQYRHGLSTLLTDEQRGRAPLVPPATPIDAVDAVMTYVILTIGALLLLGLFTRTACLAGAVFLLSVVMTQPFWVSDAQPTFNQFVEMFALLTLATTHVGRWAGLDFFVHHLIFGRREAMKGKIDASES